jgi:undecaprenyl pyrophosphate phosphatase UppP
MSEVRQAIAAVNGTLPITLEGTMQGLYSESVARTSFTLVMLAIAGAMALALGAEPRKLAKMFLRHGLVLSAVGAVVGLVAAVALARLMSSLLFGISPLDPAAYVAALVVIVLAAALATYLPARRAAQLDPIETLRAE